MYCHCGPKFVWGDIGLVRLSASDKQLTHAYICGRCGNISHAVPKGEKMYGPPSAKAPLGYHGLGDGTYTQSWATPNGKVTTMGYVPYPTRTVNGMDQGRDHLLRIWKKLDYEAEQIMRDPHHHTAEYHRNRARAFAEVVAQLMSPFYTDADAVVRESLKRYESRTAGVEHVSPGLGEYLWDPLVLAAIEKETRAAASPAPVKKMSTPKATGNRVPESAVETARQGIQMGMFTVKQMADTYKMTEAELKEQLGI